jgi:conjugal transfer pilus assembly protein TraL
MQIRIEQRLQDYPRFLMLPLDEAVLLGLPFMMGLLGRKVVIGAIVAFLAWTIWKRLKGEGGIERLLAAAYWYLPSGLGILSELPDSSVQTWEG